MQKSFPCRDINMAYIGPVIQVYANVITVHYEPFDSNPLHAYVSNIMTYRNKAWIMVILFPVGQTKITRIWRFD